MGSAGTAGPITREQPMANVLLDIVSRHGEERRAAEDARARETEILGRLMTLAEQRAQPHGPGRAVAAGATSKAGGTIMSPRPRTRSEEVPAARISAPGPIGPLQQGWGR